MDEKEQTTQERIRDYIDAFLHDEAAKMIADEIDALTRERDEARAELAGLDAGMRFQFDRAEDYKAQRDEARAEVEQLRMACGMAYGLPGARKIEVDAMRPVEKMQEIIAAVVSANGDVDREHFDAIHGLEGALNALRPAAEAWRQVFELQAKYSTHWRLNDETYWLARFMEEVGELAGALVGNHVGPVEWELSQLAAIALNWLDMRAARARAAKEAKP